MTEQTDDERPTTTRWSATATDGWTTRRGDPERPGDQRNHHLKTETTEQEQTDDDD